MNNMAAAGEAVSLLAPELTDAWDRHRQVFREMAEKIERESRFREDSQARGAAYRLLSEARAFAYNWAIGPRLAHPQIFKHTIWQTDVYGMGGNCADFLYTGAFVDGRQTYRLTGSVGDTCLFLAQVLSGLTDNTFGNYIISDFPRDAEGRFDIILSAEPQAGSWIPLDPECEYQFLWFRRALEGWDESPGSLKIERISPVSDNHYDHDEFDQAALARRIDRATDFCRVAVGRQSIDIYAHFMSVCEELNRFARFPGAKVDPAGSPSADYVIALYQVEDDEALILEFDEAPDGRYWSLEIYDAWVRSINHMTKQTTLNGRHIVPDANGGLTIVVSRQDPGIVNWLDNDGRRKGVIPFRNYEATRKVTPSVKRVPFAEIDAHLAPHVARIDPDGRRHALASRREGFRLRHEA